MDKEKVVKVHHFAERKPPSRRCWTLLIACCLLNVTSAPAQEELLGDWPAVPGYVSVFGNRFDGFRLVCEEKGLRLASLEQFAAANGDYSDWAIVVVGDAAALARADVDLRAFVENGGALLIASDTRAAYPMLDLRNEGGPVETVEERDGYQGQPQCPLVTSFSDHPVWGGITDVATNASGRLAGENVQHWIAARLPLCVATESGVDGRFAFACVWESDGRMVVLADDSVFSNEMLMEADNLLLASNVLTWLQRGTSRQVLFYDNGRLIDSWIDPRFATGEWPVSPLENWGPYLHIANEVIRAAEQEDVFNRMIASFQSGRQWRAAPAAGVLIVSLLLLFMLLSWILQGRWRSKRRKLAESPSVNSQLDQRRDELQAANLYQEPVRALSRQLFLSMGATADWSAPCPSFHIVAGLWSRLQIRKRLAHLWRLAGDDFDGRISRRRFFDVQRQVALLARMAANGTVTLDE